MYRAGWLLLMSACGFSIGVDPDAAITVDMVVEPDTSDANFACDVEEIVAGGDHTCARTTSGDVYCWGLGAYGQLGVSALSMRCGTPYCMVSPTRISLTQVRALGAGGYHTCAVAPDGEYCWGLNSFGGYGNGTTTNSMTPIMVSPVADKLAMGLYHTCSIANGTVSCSGQNAAGEVGDGSMTMQPLSTPVMTDGVNLALGDYTSCAIDDKQRLMCWGRNTYRQIDATGLNRLTPTNVDYVSNLSDVAVGRHHVCAIGANKTVTCWGNNSFGQVGNGTTSSLSPPVVALVPNAKRVVAERNYTCVLDEGGAVSCFGEGYGATPVNISLASSAATDLAAGNSHACAISASKIWCWGANNYGQLGNGTFGSPSVLTAERVDLCP